LHPGSPQIQVTISEAGFLAEVLGVVQLKGDRPGRIENANFIAVYLNGSRRQARVRHAFRAAFYGASHGDNELTAQRIGSAVRYDIVLWVEYDLGQTVSISQIHEDNTAMVTASGNPAHECDGLAEIIVRQRAAVVGSLPIAQNVDGKGCSSVCRTVSWTIWAHAGPGRFEGIIEGIVESAKPMSTREDRQREDSQEQVVRMSSDITLTGGMVLLYSPASAR